MTNIAERVRRLLARELRVHPDEVTDRARLTTDLSADHIDIVSVAMELEDAFAITIADDDVDTLESGTVADVVALVQRLLAVAA